MLTAWHLASVDASGRREPRVLFSTPECRAVVLDLAAGDVLGEHQVRERSVLEVISGTVEISSGGDALSAVAGTLVTFAPGERHAVRAKAAARVLLLLAPWPAADHYQTTEAADPARLPSNARVGPAA